MAARKYRISVHDLPEDAADRISEGEARMITGGKSGADKQKYLVVKLEEVLISSVQPGGYG